MGETLVQKKPRNNCIEFLRFTFAINFVLIHVMQVFPLAYLGFTASAALDQYIFVSSLDIIMPFITFAGYFLMAGFKRKQQQDEAMGLTPGQRAGGYLKERIISMAPYFVLAMVLGMIANGIWRGYSSFGEWLNFFLASIGELLGLQLTGIGMGNGFVGVWGSVKSPIRILSNSPLWFISGMWVCGYAVYYFLARNEKKFLDGFIPIFALLFYGACWASDTNPIWQTYLCLGDVYTLGDQVTAWGINASLINMFVGLGLGAEMWRIVDKLKKVEVTKGTKIFFTVLVVITGYVCFARSWWSTNRPLFQNYCNIGWGAAYLHSLIFCVLVLLQKDYITTSKLFNGKIWSYPGRLAMYIYMFHFPLILFLGLAMGMKGINGVVDAPIDLGNGVVLGGITPETVTKLWILYAVALVVCILVGILAMWFDTHKLRPWLKSNPFVVKK